MWFRLIISILLATLVISGCSTSSMQPPPDSYTHSTTASTVWNDNQSIKDTLYRQHQEWQGTRYQLGGLSKRGIDCSGLVYLTYLNKLGTPIPRTTAYQVQQGARVDRSALRAGDLVFFKTSVKVRHVGIYIEDGKFLHASTSKGVMVSHLDNVYWKKHFWHARRVAM